jgi:hypothetical protein
MKRRTVGLIPSVRFSMAADRILSLVASSSPTGREIVCCLRPASVKVPSSIHSDAHAARRPRAHNVSRRSNWAFRATTTVLKDMRIAPTAGLSTIPHGASTPAASGIAAML